MANYPFKINIDKGDGNQATFYTSSFATDAESLVSSSLIIDKINAIPAGATYIQSEEAVAMHPARRYGHTTAGGDASDEGILFLSASCTDANTGSISFTDTETTTNGGLNFYTFWGTKVCNVLGLPEGIPIYTENFKLSDDSSNPDNYLSGDVIANGVAVKEAFKMAPQARMRSNIVWDEVFGEGYLQWVSGSASELKIGYDTINDKYKIQAAAAPTFEISGVDTLTATTINGSLLGSVDVTGGALSLGGTNAAAVTIGNASNTVVNTFNAGATGHVFQTGIVDIEDTTDATDATGDTGALRVEGGVSIAKKLFVGGGIDDLAINDTIFHNGDTDTQIIFSANVMEFEAGGVEFFRIIEGTNDNFVVNEDSADVNFRVESNSNVAMFKVDAGLDGIGINEGSPAAALHIQQTSDNDDGGIRLYNVQDGTYWSIRVNTSEYLYFNYNGTSNGGHIRNNSDVGQITFTGQHRSSPSTGTVNNYTSSIGYIVCADGTYDNLWDNNDEVKQDTRPNINESIPRVKLSNKAKDKTVFGVISECEIITEQTTTSESIELIDDPTDPDTKIRTLTSSSAYIREFSQGAFTTVMQASSSADQKLIINSLGEGAVWICNISGSIENGDYITTSPIEGLGMKQDDDLLHNYTVAKITQDCTFDLTASASYDCVEFQWSGSTYRRAFVGCTYHCG